LELRLILLGFGAVARSFSTIISIRSEAIKRKYGASIKFVAVADRGGVAVSEEGLRPVKAGLSEEAERICISGT
jgi:homoserine dehydrogenase